MVDKPAIWVIAAGALIVTLAMGVRQTFGIFLQPVSMDLEVGRQVFGFAIAFQNLLFGLAQPFVGALADRYGARRVCLIGGIVYAAGLALTSFSQTPLDLVVTLGTVVGLALSATTYAVVLGAVGRVVRPEHRSTAFGLTTAAGSFGMFAVLPGAQLLLTEFGWADAFLVMAVLVSVVSVLALGLTSKPVPASDAAPGAAPEQTLRAALAEAGQHSGYWLLTIGFFVCGFHVAFIATHLPAFLNDQSVDPMTSAMALALIGFFNIIGSYAFGVFGDLWRKKHVLAVLYLTRSAVILAFLLVPVSGTSALLFSAAIGFLWLGTVPLTSGLVAQIFGTRYLSTLYGIVFLSHQVGSFLGAWWGGTTYDLTGSYDAIWIASVVLGVVATVLHWPITDRPVARLESATA